MAESKSRKNKNRPLKPYEIAEGVIDFDAYVTFKALDEPKELVFDTTIDVADDLLSYFILDPSNDGSGSILLTLDDWDLEDLSLDDHDDQ